MVVQVDVLSIHYDKDLWGPEDPYEFFPERHSADRQRNPASELSFGYGPRSN
jgi:cytochrome P450